LKIASTLEKRIIFIDNITNVDKIDTDEKLKSNNEKLTQQFLDAIKDLKDSLQVVEAENLDLTDGLDKLRPDSLFIGFVPSASKGKTQNLIDNIDFNLSEAETIVLISDWRTAVNLFTEDAHKRNEKKADGTAGEVTPFKADTFAHFFRIHKELEILYSRLAETETFQESR
jgi:hypothetical protein